MKQFGMREVFPISIGIIVAIISNIIFSYNFLTRYSILRIAFIFVLINSTIPIIAFLYSPYKWVKYYRIFSLGFCSASAGFVVGRLVNLTFKMEIYVPKDLYDIIVSLTLSGIFAIYENLVNYIEKYIS